MDLIYNYFLKIDYFLFYSLNQYALKSEVLDGAAVFFAQWSGYLMIAVFLFFLWRKRTKNKFKTLLTVFLPAFISRFGIVVLIRALHFRARPFLSLETNQLLNHNGAEPS
ncbi:MAG: hypothetical protein Q8L57_01405, partial [bacterium]|nr:hypothetical protein [bacterium]